MSTEEKAPARVEKEAPVSRNLAPMHSLREEIDRVFDRFGMHFPSLSEPFSGRWDPFKEMMSWPRSGSDASPRVDVTESDDSYEISAEFPGMDKDDIEVSMANGNLVLKGEKRQEKETKEKDYHLMERSYGGFRRVLPLPAGVDEEKIAAQFKQGVLTLTLPKTEEAQKQQRTIEVSEG